MESNCIISVFLLMAFSAFSQGIDPVWNEGFYSDAPILAQYYESVQEVKVDFSRLLYKLKVKGTFDINSVRVFETDGSGEIIGKELPSEFVPDKSFDIQDNAYGSVVFQVRGEKDMDKAEKIYRIFFDVEQHGKKPKPNYPDIGEPNLIPDPSFEGGNATRIPLSPHFYPIGKSRIHDLTVGRSGKSSIRFQAPKGNRSTGLYVTAMPSYKKLGIRIKPSSPYKFSMWVKGKDLELNSANIYKLVVSGGAYWYKGFDDSKTDFIAPWKSWGIWKFPRDKTTFSFDWTQKQAILLAPANAHSVKFIVNAYPDTGYLWLDDCLLTPASPAELTKGYKIIR